MHTYSGSVSGGAARRGAAARCGSASVCWISCSSPTRRHITHITSPPVSSAEGGGGGLHAQTGAVGRGFSRGLGRGGRKQRKHAAHHSRRGARRRLRNRQVRFGGKRTTEGELRASAPLHRGRGSPSRLRRGGLAGESCFRDALISKKRPTSCLAFVCLRVIPAGLDRRVDSPQVSLHAGFFYFRLF